MLSAGIKAYGFAEETEWVNHVRVPLFKIVINLSMWINRKHLTLSASGNKKNNTFIDSGH